MSGDEVSAGINDGRDLVIRPFVAGDENLLWTVFHASVHQLTVNDYTQRQRDIWAPAAANEAWLARVRANQPLLALVEQKIVGYADLQPSGYIDHFFVHAAVARQGVGSRLMEAIHIRAQNQVIAQLHSEVSITARPFFENWGFSVKVAQTVERQGITFRNFRMVKHLRK